MTFESKYHNYLLMIFRCPRISHLFKLQSISWTSDLMHFKAVKCLICFDTRTTILSWCRGVFRGRYLTTNFHGFSLNQLWNCYRNSSESNLRETLIPPYNPLIQSQHDPVKIKLKNYPSMTFIYFLILTENSWLNIYNWYQF